VIHMNGCDRSRGGTVNDEYGNNVVGVQHADGSSKKGERHYYRSGVDGVVKRHMAR
jgi:hypothetical protein